MCHFLNCSFLGSKERDNETGLDFFGARYFSSVQGRFTSVDPGSLGKRHLINPQKWNRYSYTINNPLRYFDPDGMEEIEVIVRTYIPGERVTFAGKTFSGNEDAKGNRLPGPEGYKTEHRIRVETDRYKNDGKVLIGKPTTRTGITHEYNSDGSVKTAQGKGDTLSQSAKRDSSGRVLINVRGDEGNPLTPQALTPGITYNLNIILNPRSDGSIGVGITGTHDQFPAYEIILSRPEALQSDTTLYNRPPASGVGPEGLFLNNVNVNVQRVVPAPLPMELLVPKKKKEDE